MRAALRAGPLRARDGPQGTVGNLIPCPLLIGGLRLGTTGMRGGFALCERSTPAALKHTRRPPCLHHAWRGAPPAAPSPRPVYLRAEADGQPEAGGLVPARHSSCASVYTTAAEMLARWCAKNELGDRTRGAVLGASARTWRDAPARRARVYTSILGIAPSRGRDACKMHASLRSSR